MVVPPPMPTIAAGAEKPAAIVDHVGVRLVAGLHQVDAVPGRGSQPRDRLGPRPEELVDEVDDLALPAGSEVPRATPVQVRGQSGQRARSEIEPADIPDKLDARIQNRDSHGRPRARFRTDCRMVLPGS
jgi:hypothetical protein